MYSLRIDVGSARPVSLHSIWARDARAILSRLLAETRKRTLRGDALVHVGHGRHRRHRSCGRFALVTDRSEFDALCFYGFDSAARVVARFGRAGLGISNLQDPIRLAWQTLVAATIRTSCGRMSRHDGRRPGSGCDSQPILAPRSSYSPFCRWTYGASGADRDHFTTDDQRPIWRDGTHSLDRTSGEWLGSVLVGLAQDTLDCGKTHAVGWTGNHRLLVCLA